MPDTQESRRRPIARLLVLMSGILGLAGAIWIVLHRQPAGPHSPTNGITPKPAMLQALLYLIVLLILVFAVSLIAFLRWSRGFRRLILRRPVAPTPAEDVWQMHRLPEESEPDDLDELADRTE